MFCFLFLDKNILNYVYTVLKTNEVFGLTCFSLHINNQPILAHFPISIPPENPREPKVF